MTYIDDDVSLNANKIDVDSQLTRQSSTGYVEEQVSDGIAAVVITPPLVSYTLKDFAAALNNDSIYTATVLTQLGYKADQATTYTNTKTEAMLNGKAIDRCNS